MKFVTTDAVKSAFKGIVSTVSKRLVNMRTVGVCKADEAKITSIIKTMLMASNRDELDSFMPGTSYALDDYKVDERLAPFALPCKVEVPATGMRGEDLRDHVEINSKEVLSPSAFSEAQFDLLAEFKKTPNFTSDLRSLTAPKALSDVSNFMNSDGMCNAAATHLPVALSYPLWKDSSYICDVDLWTTNFIENIASSFRD